MLIMQPPGMRARKNWTGCCFWIKIRFYRMVFSIVTSMQFLLIRICNFSFHRSFSRKVRSFLPFRRWKAQKNPLSPGRIYPIKHYLLINSGLCVKLSLFERSGGYDERIWLDFADTQFVRKLWHSGERYFYLLPCKCFQNFSNEQTNIEKLQSRFEIYLECGKNCKFLDFPDWAFRQYCVISHTLSLTIRTRKISFLTKSITKYWMRR